MGHLFVALIFFEKIPESCVVDVLLCCVFHLSLVVFSVYAVYCGVCVWVRLCVWVAVCFCFACLPAHTVILYITT